MSTVVYAHAAFVHSHGDMAAKQKKPSRRESDSGQARRQDRGLSSSLYAAIVAMPGTTPF